MRRRNFIWLLPVLMVLYSITRENECSTKLFKKTAENIYGHKIKRTCDLESTNSILIIMSGRDCHDCVQFLIREAVRTDVGVSFLYLVDVNKKLEISAKREIIQELKVGVSKENCALDDNNVFFLSRENLLLDSSKLPIVAIQKKQMKCQKVISYNEIWEAMEKKTTLL